MTCDGDKFFVAATSGNVGATVIRQECGCSISADSETIPKPLPCLKTTKANGPLVHQIIPASWSWSSFR